MRKIILRALIVLLAWVFFSCNEEEQISNNKADIRFKAVSSNFNLKSASQTGTIVSIQTAMIGISEIELEMEYEEEIESEDGESEYENDVEYEIEFSGPYTVDLIAATSAPEIVISNIEQGVYSEFECEIENVMDNGKSVYIEGEVDIDEIIYTFVFESKESFEIEIEGYEHFNQPISINELWTIGFDLDYLFSGLNFESIEIDENNKILINNTSNSSLYSQIKNRLEDSFDFEDDDNQDDD